LLGTVGYQVEGAPLETASHTTPDAPRLQRMLARHRFAGGDSVVLEASSHALDQRRLAGLELDVAVFTNLTRDHLDYHGTFEAYKAAKARLFHALPPGGAAVLPATGDIADEFARIAVSRGARVIRYGAVPSLGHRASTTPDSGRRGSRVDLQATRLNVTSDGLKFSISGMGITDRSTPLSLSGRHNVDNLLAAAAAVLATGADPAALQTGFASIPLPPGRLERVSPEGHPFHCSVDYAHTPDALRTALTGLRAELEAAGRGRLVCVFGCGGDRDRGKRPQMGAVVGELADLAVLTSDNPRSEDPERIVADVLEGMEDGRAETAVEVDRRRAIELALGLARPGDHVLIAGKGHEDYQILPGGRIHFDDREVVREVLG
ncbi:MAG: UDP-N-acetylmuramoyl-L-alanyl-D-glutamate--2,6-diaminopimelate ligase, partial [Planctomycetota bacterium]